MRGLLHISLACSAVLWAGSIEPVQAAAPITAICFAPDAQSVVTGSQEGIVVWSWPDLKQSRAIETKLAHVHDLKFAPEGDFLAAAGGAPGEEGAMEVFVWPQGTLRNRTVLADDVALAVAWRPDGKGWAAAGFDTAVYLADAEGKVATTLRGHSRPVTALAFLPDGESLVSAGVDQSLRMWEAATGKPLRSLDNHTRPVTALAIRPGGKPDATPVVASTGEDRTVRLWQPTIGRLMRFAKLPEYATDLAWTPDGRLIVAACRDGRLRVIDPDTVKIIREIDAFDGWIHCLAISPDGKMAAVGGEGGRLIGVKIAIEAN